MNIFTIIGLIVDDLNNTRTTFDCFSDTENKSVLVFCNRPERIADDINVLTGVETDGKYYDIQFTLDTECNVWEVGYIHHNNGIEDVRQKIREYVESLGLIESYRQICENIVNQAD